MSGEAQVLPRQPRCLLSALTGIDLSQVTLTSESQWADQSHTKLFIQSVCPASCRTVEVERHSKSTRQISS